MINVSIFDASPGADYGNLGRYIMPVVPTKGDVVWLFNTRYVVTERQFFPETGVTSIYVRNSDD